MTAMQNDVKVTEANLINYYLGNVLTDAVSLNKYQAIILADKSAFFAGEKFQGKVVIGKYANVPPTKLVVQGTEINLEKAIDSTGAAKLDFNVGRVGEHDIKGKFRGVTNPMTISFAGVPDNKVSASGSGLSKGSGVGKYNMRPGSGREVKISVSATLDDGSRATDSQTFRIKDIPKPTGTFNGQTDNVKLPRNNVQIGKVGAKLVDFDFELPIQVTSFKFKVPGQPTINVQGTKLNSRAKDALRKARRGAGIQVFDIKAKITGNSSYRLKKVSPHPN